MHKLETAHRKWWNKPLVKLYNRFLPAELAILSLEIRPGEQGAWLNSRNSDSGVVDLARKVRNGKVQYITRREKFPEFVSKKINNIFRLTKLKRGCPDLVIWDLEAQRLRLIEVKCPRWDKLTQDQQKFMHVAKLNGISVKIVEWELFERGTVNIPRQKTGAKKDLKSHP
jgi:hypothetical protein